MCIKMISKLGMQICQLLSILKQMFSCFTSMLPIFYLGKKQTILYLDRTHYRFIHFHYVLAQCLKFHYRLHIFIMFPLSFSHSCYVSCIVYPLLLCSLQILITFVMFLRSFTHFRCIPSNFYSLTLCSLYRLHTFVMFLLSLRTFVRFSLSFNRLFYVCSIAYPLSFSFNYLDAFIKIPERFW